MNRRCGVPLSILALALGWGSAALAQPDSRAVAARRAADSLWNRAVSFDGAPDFARGARELQASLRAHDFVDGFQREYLRYMAAKAGQLDLAFAQVDTLLAQGWLDLNNTFNFAADNAEMMADRRWPAYERRVIDRQAEALRAMSPASLGLDPSAAFDRVARLFDDTRPSVLEVAGALREFRHFPTPTRTGAWMLRSLRVTAVPGPPVEVWYFTWIPRGYTPQAAHPMVLWSHQGWYYRPQPVGWYAQPNRFDNPFWWSREAHDLIQVVPLMWRDLDGSTVVGQQVLREIVAATRRVLNVDDDRIVMAGHSNGGSAALRAVAESPSVFAGAVALNGWPDPGLAMRNWRNRRIRTWSGEQDKLFLSADVGRVHAWAQQLGVPWELDVVPGADHGIRVWVPDAMPALLSSIRGMRREPTASQRVVQSIGTAPLRIDWLAVDQVDTARARAPWDSVLTTPVVATAGDGARGSPKGSVVQNATAGVIEGTYVDNTFDLRASRVRRLSVYVSPGMVDLSRPVIVRVDGVQRHAAVVTPDRRVLRQMFFEGFDRRALFVARIAVTLPA